MLLATLPATFAGYATAGDATAPTVAGHRVTTGAAAGYVADSVCADCHGELARSYTAVGMSRSFARPAEAEVIEDFENNRFHHAASGRWYEMRRDGDRLLFRRWREDETGRRSDEIEIEVDWILGSGHRSRTYLYANPAGELFQLPLAWYSQPQSWGMAPGFDRPAHLGLRRQVHRDCMACHNAFPQVPVGSDLHSAPHRFPSELPSGIGCQRCHGPGAAHVDLASGGLGSKAKIRAAIVNPAKLSPELRDDVCFQCHMQPSVAIAGVRPLGVGAYAFRPGTPLPASLLHVDVELREERFEINHHPYRLLQSTCWQESARRLTCITCHDPHRKVPPAERSAHYRDACRTCHGADDCSLPQMSDGAPVDPVTGSAVRADDCTACHMPQRRTDDVIQVVMTDHRIQRRPAGPSLLEPRPERDPEMVAVDLFDPRAPDGELGVVYLSLGLLRVSERSAPETLERLRRSAAVAAPDAVEPHLELGRGYLLSGDYAAARRALSRVLAAEPEHAVALGWMATATIGLGQSAAGLDFLRRSLAADPLRPEASYNLGLALLAFGHPEEALGHLRRAVELSPTLAAAWTKLGQAQESLGQEAEARMSYRRALAVEPAEATARRALELLEGKADGGNAQSEETSEG